jgi:ribosomal protein L7/L12
MDKVDNFLRDDDPRMAEVVALVRAGKKIRAIKLYRQLTGAGFQDANDAIERIE